MRLVAFRYQPAEAAQSERGRCVVRSREGEEEGERGRRKEGDNGKRGGGEEREIRTGCKPRVSELCA